MPNGNGGGSERGAAGGSGSGAGQSIADQIKATLDDLVKNKDDIENHDDATSRSVVCKIDNVCGHTLNFESDHFDHGGYAADVAPASIEDKKPRWDTIQLNFTTVEERLWLHARH